MNKKEKAFTLIEILVAMVVLSIGLLGMAAMTIMIQRGHKTSEDLTVAGNLCTTKMEALKDLGWESLGSAEPTASDRWDKGVTSGRMLQEGPMDKTGSMSGEVQKLRFYRNFVVCSGRDYNSNTSVWDATATGVDADPVTKATDFCAVNPEVATSRPEELSCLPTDIQDKSPGSNEKKIKLLCTWRSGDGLCHRVDIGTTVVQFN